MYVEACEDKRPKPTKSTEIVCSKISDILWMIKREIEDPKKQEEFILAFLGKLGWYKDMKKLAAKLMDIEKKYQLMEIEEDEAEAEEEADKNQAQAMLEEL